jgi:hypothetical protein
MVAAGGFSIKVKPDWFVFKNIGLQTIRQRADFGS